MDELNYKRKLQHLERKPNRAFMPLVNTFLFMVHCLTHKRGKHKYACNERHSIVKDLPVTPDMFKILDGPSFVFLSLHFI